MGMDALQGGANPGLSGPRGGVVAGGGDPASLMKRLRPLIAQRMQQQGQPVAQQMPAQIPNPAGAQDPTVMTMPGTAQKPQMQAGVGNGRPWSPAEMDTAQADNMGQFTGPPGTAGQGGFQTNFQTVDGSAPVSAWQHLKELGIEGQGSPAANKARWAAEQQKAGGGSGGIVAPGAAGGPSSAGGAAPVGGIQTLRQKVLDAAGAGAIARDARPGVMTKPAVRGGNALRRRAVQ